VSQQDPGQHEEAPEGKRSPAPADLAYELSGKLPCTTCGYNLAGLSVLERCPECGTQIRDTLLVVVDPFADEVPKVRRPRVIAVSVLGWSGAALGAALAMLAHRGMTILCGSNRAPCGIAGLDVAGVALLFCTALFALGLLRPMRSTKLAASVAAVGGSLAMSGAAVVAAITILIRDPYRMVPYVDVGDVDGGRVVEHLCATTLMLVAVVLLRPNARAVSSTSWRLRGNHANKQRLVTVAASLGVIVVGDALQLLGAEVARDLRAALVVSGAALVLVGSGVLTAALYGVLSDSICIAKTLWRVPIAFRDVVRRSS
jgi:hypothetical protein